METKTRILTPLLLLCVGALLGMMLTKCNQQPITPPEPQILRDTITEVKIDTQYYAKPVPYKVEVRDTIRLTDTIYAGGQTFCHETKHYGDNSTYSLQISGINAYLDWIETYPKTVTEYIYETKEVTIQPKKLSLWTGAELRKYGSKFSAPISLEVRYNENRYEIFARGGYDLINNSEVIEVGAKRRF